MYHYPDFRCQIEAMSLVTVLFSLLAMWTALGRGWWFTRAAVGCIVIAGLLPIKAYQPVVFFVVTTFGSVLLLVALRYGPERFRCVRVTESTNPPSSRNSALGIGIAAGLVVASASSAFASNSFPMLGWQESLVVFGISFFAVLFGSLALSERVRLGGWRIDKSVMRLAQFSLADVLLLMVLIAIASSMIAYSLRMNPISDWRRFAVVSVLSIAFTCTIAVGTTSVRFRVAIVSLLGSLLTLVVAIQYAGEIGTWFTESSAYGHQAGGTAQSVWTVIVCLNALSLLNCSYIASTTGLIQLNPIDDSQPTTSKRVARFAGFYLLLVLGICLAPIYAKMTNPLARKPRLSNAGDPELYRHLIAAAKSVQEMNPRLQTVQELVNAGDTQAADAISQQYVEIKSLVHQPFSVLENHDDAYDVANRLDYFRTLARSFDNESTAAVKTQAYHDACEWSTQCLWLGSGISRNGSVSHTLTGIAIESVGQKGIGKIRNQISLMQIRRLLPELITIERNRESLVSIRRGAQLEGERFLGWRYRLSMYAAELSSMKPNDSKTILTPTLEATEEALLRRDAIHWLLTLELAIRLFADVHGSNPFNLQQLVPEFLPAVPVDPYVGEPFVYRQVDSHFELYSVGRGLQNDGGKFGCIKSMYEVGYDFDLDTPWRP